MRRNLFLSLLLLLPLHLGAQSLGGTWEGAIELQGHKLRIVFHVTAADGGYKAVMDSPDQGARGLPVASAVLANGTVGFDMPAIGAKYQGVLSGEHIIVGTLVQGGAQMILTLRRTSEDPKMLRPQDPTAPISYTEEEVTIENADAGITLHGTLTSPYGAERYPAVILMTGSGVQNRDEEIAGHRPFRILADRLTRQGIAVLRCDDRGFGLSREELTEQITGSTAADFTDDVLCMYRYLAAHPNIDSANIGVLGHSEGGTIAFMAAAREPKIAFVVSMAGMAVRGGDLLLTQNKTLMQMHGVSESVADAYCRALASIFTATEGYSAAQIPAFAQQIADNVLADAGAEIPDAMRDNLRQVVSQLASPWLHYFVNYDPAIDIAAIGVRAFFALNGTKDSQVDAAINLGAVDRLTTSKRNPQSVIRHYDGLNHLFQHCVTGSVAEYAQIEETISEEVLSDIANWINAVTLCK